MANASSSRKWIFRGEGNACLVLVNTEEKRVYRLAKAKYWGENVQASNAARKSDRIHEEMQLVIDYMKDVMQPLLSPYFVVIPELCLMANGATHEAEKEAHSSRPAQRKGKDVEHFTVDPTTQSALLMPDMCFVRGSTFSSKCSTPTISVEIKPKKAFIHTEDISQSEVKSQVCKFCMHQRLKAKEGQWPVTSRYCPLDLFSGRPLMHLQQTTIEISEAEEDILFILNNFFFCRNVFNSDRARMKIALLALAETPQNNLRICQDGEEIHGAWNMEDLNEVLDKFMGNWHNELTNGMRQNKSLQVFLDLVIEALLYVPATKNCSSCDNPCNNCSYPVQYCQSSRYTIDQMSTSSCRLPTGCVLERILTTQRLDSVDIDGVYPLYQQLDTYLNKHPNERSRLCLDGPFNPNTWLEPCVNTLSNHRRDDHIITEGNVTQIANQIKRFLVSKTVQDCSIMVALQRVPDSFNEDSIQHVLKDTSGCLYKFSVTLVDLDPKPFNKIPSYHKQDRMIVSAYKEACGSSV